MKKSTLIGIIMASIILIGLIVFASVKKYDDSHLRVEGIRVRVNEGALVVDGCDEKTANAAYCEKTVEVKGKNQKFVFEFKNFKKNGYPGTIRASLNGHEFYRKDDLNIETKGSNDYPIFLNFNPMGDYIVFTFTNGTTGRSTTLYALDTEGNIILEETEIDKDDMLIKDYTDFIDYQDNTIKIYATRVVEDINYKGQNICYAKPSEVVEAYYTYTLKDGKFTKKQTKTITAAKFIEEKGIICANKK